MPFSSNIQIGHLWFLKDTIPCLLEVTETEREIGPTLNDFVNLIEVKGKYYPTAVNVKIKMIPYTMGIRKSSSPAFFLL